MATTVDQTTNVDTINSVNNNPYITAQGQQTQAANATVDNTVVDNTAVNAADNTTTSTLSNVFGNFDTNKFLMGVAIGAAGAYLLTNESAQKALFKTFAKGSDLFNAGIEEIKERFEDAKAEMEANS